MPSVTRRATGLLCVLTVVATLPAPPAAATPPAATPPTTTRTTAEPRPITLVTGDRFLVSGDGRSVTRLPSPGREDAPYVVDRRADGITVLPTDAQPLVNAGKVDARLFDVTRLLEYGYDDRRGTLPLVISYTDGDAGEQAVRDVTAATAATVTAKLEPIDGLAVEQRRDHLADLWKRLTGPASDRRPDSLGPRIARIHLDAKVSPDLDVSVPQVQAPTAWAAGHDGTGVKIGVVDTGVDVDHPDLKGHVVARDFTKTDLTDTHGHGTHVASTMAGTGAASGGRYKGVAPGATVYSGKACVRVGSSAACDESAIIQAIQWLVAEQVPVINLSLGGPDTTGVDILEQTVQEITASTGTLFVVSAGNSGQHPIRGLVGSPGSAPDALAVGAVTKADTFARLTSVGPTVDDALVKPEIVAPGVDITAARNGGGYQPLTGTSMAAPHVAGAAAILLQRHPDWKAPQLKAALVASAQPIAANVFEQGGGRLDVGRAATQQLTTTPATLSLGRVRAVGTPTVTRTVTYANASADPVTLELSIDVAGPDAPAPAGMFRLSATTVTVPARGTASVEVTSAPPTDARAGLYSGRLVASRGGTVVLRTAVGLDLRPQEFKLTVRHTGRYGTVPAVAAARIIGLDSQYDNVELHRPSPNGEETYVLPKGRYVVASNMRDVPPGATSLAAADLTQLVHPNLLLDRDTVLEMDARQAKPLDLRVGKPGAVVATATVNITVNREGGGQTLGTGIGQFDLNHLFTGRVGPPGPADAVTSHVAAMFVQRRADGSTEDTPYTVQVALREPGTVLDGYRRTIDERSLATVHTSIAQEVPNSGGSLGVVPIWRGVEPDILGISIGFRLPARRTDYVATHPDLAWYRSVYTDAGRTPDDRFPQYVSNFTSVEERYEAGRTYHEALNRGVFSPTFRQPSAALPELGLPDVFRDRNRLDLSPRMFGDGAGRSGSTLGSGHATLTRDGVTVSDRPGTRASAEVPAEPHRYRYTATDTREGLAAGLSTVRRLTWEFTSANTPAEQPLPLSLVRFTPKLDDNNTAEGAAFLLLPFRVERQPGSAPSRTTHLTVEASFDGGTTWHTPLTLRINEAGWSLVRRPSGHGTVSLRVRATDAAGSTVEQEIVNAVRF